MRQIWRMINSLKCSGGYKNAIFLTLMTLTGGILGGVVWLAAVRELADGILWLLCCMGYPAFFIGLIGGIWYLYRHSFS